MEEIQALFRIVAEEYLGLSRLMIDRSLKDQLPAAKEHELKEIVKQLYDQRPIQHILGKAPFYGMDIKVNEYTLIPRPETEELIELIIKQHNHQSLIRIIDIGTGSGCIAIALAKHLKNSIVRAVDISTEAIYIAQENANTQQVSVDFQVTDILNWESVFGGDEKFDIVVSNPPYITQDEKKHMSPNVLDHEPHTALFVEDEDPLLFYRSIGHFAMQNLKDNGSVYFEINQYLTKETTDLLIEIGFQNVDVYKDINNAERIISAKKRSIDLT